MNLKLLIILLFLLSGFMAGSFLYTPPTAPEKPTDPFAEWDPARQPQDTPPAPPPRISSDSGQHNAFIQNAPPQHSPTQTAPNTPGKDVSPGVGEVIAHLACKTADAVARVIPDGQGYDCVLPETSFSEPAPDMAAHPFPAANQTPPTRGQRADSPDFVAVPPSPTPPNPATVQTQTTPATPLHETVTNRFPANGTYRDGLDIDGWPVSCGTTPIQVIDSFYEGTKPDGRGRYDGYRMATFRTTTRGNSKISEILLSSSALKTKRTLTKLYQFYWSCATSQSPTRTGRGCWIAEKGRQDGWLTQDGVQFLCRATDIDTCGGLKRCFSGLPPAQAYTRVAYTDPLMHRYTNEFPPEGTYPPGSLRIDGLPVRCGNTPVRILSAPGAEWLGQAILDENLIHLNRDALVNQSTAGKLGVFSDECAHITYQASNYEALCGGWMIRKQNGWIDDRSVEDYCRDVKTNFYSGGHYLEETSPEEACQRARACYAGTTQPIQGSLWSR